jgi:rare lipoprotein A
MKNYIFLLILHLLPWCLEAQDKNLARPAPAGDSVLGKVKVYFGTASYYAEKFNGRKTANGETYDSKKYTAACNVLPLGTWIRVTNLRNKRSVIVKTNDRLHVSMKRIVDLSFVAAEKLGYTGRGLTQVKVEVLGRKPG